MGDHILFRDRTAYLNTVSKPSSMEDPTPRTKYGISFQSVEDAEIFFLNETFRVNTN